ncbi:MAG TPA: F0F1 ATP synthase subunit A [Candidatus Saccharimonadales bacterium]|nr:F0F1 ATP synthase subunit A [Candidatus Saccharimonadales bacterium]
MSLFAVGEAGPVVHVAPHTFFTIGGFPISNAILYGWLSALAICVILILVARRVRVKPQGGIVQYFEFGVDFVTNLVESAFDDPKKGRKYVPYFITLFFFILINNWFSLLPFVGDGFQLHGAPLLRAFTADLNGTLAMGAVTMAVVYGASIKESGGFFKYLRHFFVGSPLNPMYFLIGIIEMITDLTRVLSLSLRLFLNITIGDIVIAVFAYLGHVLAPITALPFTLLEFGVDALQAYIFVVLSVMYLAMTVNAHSEEHDLTEELVTETIGASEAEATA